MTAVSGGRAPRPAPFFVSINNLDNWSGRARAVADACDELRSLISALDRAIQRERCEHRAARVREVAIRNAEALRLALKLPARERRRGRGDPYGTAFN